MTETPALNTAAINAAKSGSRFGTRRLVLIAIVAAGVWAFVSLELNWNDLWPNADRWSKIGAFIGAAFSPAIDYEKPPAPGTNPLLLKAFYAAISTLIFAITAASLSILVGLALAFGGSTAWWADDPVGATGPITRLFRRTARPLCYFVTRVLIALSRSTHELIWAVLFAVALGLNNVTAMFAIVIPYSGTLAKVFSEMIDESPRDAAIAMRNAGAAPFQTFTFGLLPRAVPDMVAYALYRFECAVRSSAVLGFFGITTLGSYLHTSFEQLHYHEVWTYLYTLIALVILIDLWSSAVRRRLVR